MLTIGLLAIACSVAAAGTDRSLDRLLATRAACPAGYIARAPFGVQMRGMACLVAYARSHVGVQPLRLSPVLNHVAALKVEADVACGQFSHTPCGRAFITWYKEAGYGAGSSGYAVGENLAWGRGSEASPAEIMRMWLASPEHRRNLLSPAWREFGMGVRLRATFVGGPGAVVWANEFSSLELERRPARSGTP